MSATVFTSDSNRIHEGGDLVKTGGAADLAMGSAGSVQREPSMEEILASIRRIIEESDAERRTPLREDVSGANDDDGVEMAEVEQFRAEFRVAPSVVGEPQAASVSKSFSPDAGKPAAAAPALVAGISVAAAQEPMTSRTEAVQREFESAYEPRVEARIVAEPVALPLAAATVQPEPPAEIPLEGAPEVTNWVEPEPVAIEPQADDSATDFDALGEEMARAALDALMPAAAEARGAHEPGAGAARPAILSERAGRQVAASFGELSEAFAASRRRTFDEMAEELMRPMLQEWLDNNLPLMVERLVREEIERIARS